MPIQVLPDQLISQIAAGEVVERPASVVKELLENALDAGASNIHVAVVDGGRKLIRVSDDGSGIQSVEAQLAFARHATSKLRSIDDLLAIRTLGFRGEALSSIAAVSRITMTTRHRDETAGLQLRLEGGQLSQNRPVGAPAGTVVSVENLFFNTPARLKFLKKENTEKRHITLLVTRYAMAYPDVRFTLEQDGREVFRSGGSGQLSDVLVHVLGLENFKLMLPVELDSPEREDHPPITVAGFTSSPELHRADRSHISLFVNGRWIQDSNLTYAVVQAYHGLLKPGRYPVAVLMIALNPEEVDVNVHPTKAEVRFRDANAVFAVVQRGVRRAIVGVHMPDHHSGIFPGRERSLPDAWREDTQAQLDFELEESATITDKSRHPRDVQADDPTAIPEGMGRPAKPRTLPLLRVVGQVGARYIIAEGPAGIYLIDQHSAHQRVLYEQLMDTLARHGTLPAEPLPGPQTANLSSADTRLLEKHLDVLEVFGFEIEPFGPSSFMVRAVTAPLAHGDIDDMMADLIAALADGSGVLEDRLLICLSRLGSYRSGQVLSPDAMQDLVRQLERCQSPLLSPDGLPTLIHMSGDQLAREFNRRPQD